MRGIFTRLGYVTYILTYIPILSLLCCVGIIGLIPFWVITGKTFIRFLEEDLHMDFLVNLIEFKNWDSWINGHRVNDQP